ncbi:MAG: hypothetical protein ABJQ39_10500 [Winogradskyella arenosi]
MTIIITLIIGAFIGFYIYNVTTKNQEEYLNSEEFKKRNSNIKKPTKSNEQERNESMLRMASNMNIPVEKVKEDYMQDLKKNKLKADFKEEMLFQIGAKKIEESISFNISPQNTATAIMEEWLIEYFDDLKNETTEVENFIKNNFEMFRKLKNKQKIEMHDFFDLSRFLELEKTQKLLMGFDFENNIHMDMVLLFGALNEMENKAEFFFKQAIPIMKVDPKILLKIIDFGLKLEDYDYTPHFYELRSGCKKELNLYGEALEDIDIAIQLISEIDWKKEDYYDDYKAKKSELKQLLESTIINCKSIENKDEKLRIWPTTYLIDKSTNTKYKLLNANGISIYPEWSILKKGETFSLIFEKLPPECSTFSLVEEIPESDGFLVENIKRNNSEFYEIEI